MFDAHVFKHLILVSLSSRCKHVQPIYVFCAWPNQVAVNLILFGSGMGQQWQRMGLTHVAAVVSGGRGKRNQHQKARVAHGPKV